MPPPNPVADTHSSPPRSVSSTSRNIAGISVTLHGLAEATPGPVAVLWLLHPRLQNASSMSPLASDLISSWNKTAASKSLGLVAASFDQRNHGGRLVSALANEAWRDGNATHAQDMFGQFSGTQRDLQQLIELLPAYVPAEMDVAHHAALGVSLGGHCAWHALLHVPQVAAAVVVIGCPDYAALMADRARLSKRPSWKAGGGAEFFGSDDFPPALVDSVRRLDPRGLLVGDLPMAQAAGEEIQVSHEQQRRAAGIVKKKLANKKLLCLSGGADKLVPYARGKPFMDLIKKGLQPGGWAAGNGFELQDLIFDGVGHNMPPAMVDEARKFLFADLDAVATGAQRTSRI